MSNRKLGGLRAKRSGEIAETEFDISASEYARFGQAHCQPTYAEFVVTKRLKGGQCVGFFKEKATSDRVLSIADLGGRTCWIEIKHVKAKDQKTIQNTMHQYRQMFDAQRDGNALCFYIVRWNYNSNIEWRLYPISTLDVDYDDATLTIIRESGLLVGGMQSPDWLPVVTEYARLTG